MKEYKSIKERMSHIHFVTKDTNMRSKYEICIYIDHRCILGVDSAVFKWPKA